MITKKTLSLMLAVIMILTLLTGCNSAGLGYLQLEKEASNVREFTFENKTNFDVNVPTENIDIELGLEVKGEMSVEDLKDIYGGFELTPTINKVKYETVNLKLVDNKLYISPNALKLVPVLTEMFNGSEEISAEVVDYVLNDGLKDIDYIVIDEESVSMYSNGEIPENADIDEIQELVEDYLVTVFEDFDYKLVEKVATNSYEIELDAEIITDFVVELVDYISDNKEVFFDESLKLFIAWAEMSGEYTAEDIAMLEEEFENSKEEMYQYIDELNIQIKAELEMNIEELEGFNAKLGLRKEKDKYIEELAASYVEDGEGAIYFSTTSIMTPAELNKPSMADSKIMTTEEMEVEFEKIERKMNPVTEMNIYWNSNNKYAVYSRVESVNKDLTTESTEYPYTVIEGRIYLPLRAICEAFGEDVEWNNELRKAYIIRGEEKVDMTGIIVNDRTMIKVRDFEKLGYTVGYTQTSNGVSTATLISNK